MDCGTRSSTPLGESNTAAAYTDSPASDANKRRSLKAIRTRAMCSFAHCATCLSAVSVRKPKSKLNSALDGAL